MEHTLPEDNYQAVDELTQPSAVRETAGQEFEPDYAWRDHVFIWWELCLFVCKNKPSKSTYVCCKKELEHQWNPGKFHG